MWTYSWLACWRGSLAIHSHCSSRCCLATLWFSSLRSSHFFRCVTWFCCHCSKSRAQHSRRHLAVSVEQFSETTSHWALRSASYFDLIWIVGIAHHVADDWLLWMFSFVQFGLQAFCHKATVSLCSWHWWTKNYCVFITVLVNKNI